MKDCTLIVDGTCLSKKQVGMINQIALAYKMAEATVIFIECIPPNTSLKARNRLRTLGYGFDELVQIPCRHKGLYEPLLAREIVKAADKETVVLSGYPMLLERLSRIGLRGMMYT